MSTTLCGYLHVQIFWSKKLALSTTQAESLQEFRHVLPARHLSYVIDDLHLDTTYLVQVLMLLQLLPFHEILVISKL